MVDYKVEITVTGSITIYDETLTIKDGVSDPVLKASLLKNLSLLYDEAKEAILTKEVY